MLKKFCFLFIFGFVNLFALSYEHSFLTGRLSVDDPRYETFSYVLRLLKERKVKCCVETGTARYAKYDFTGDGGSTVIFGHWAKVNGTKLYSIDINADNLEASKEACADYLSNIVFIQSDSVDFLSKFSEKIDFLYLDS
jgi:predicted O-methyltransferase YrrM